MMPFSLHAFCTVSLRSKTFLYAKKPAEFSAGFFTRFFDQKLLLFFGIHDFSAVVITALLADLMRLFELMAMRAFNQIGSRSLEIRIPRIRSLFRLFRLRYRHFIYTSLPKFTIILKSTYKVYNISLSLSTFFSSFSVNSEKSACFIYPTEKTRVYCPTVTSSPLSFSREEAILTDDVTLFISS